MFTIIDTIQWFILPAAFVVDSLVGDPRFLPHPIRWMGRAIEICEPFFRRIWSNPFVAGTFFAVFLILSTWGLTSALTVAAYWFHPAAGVVLEVVILFYCFSARSLAQAAMEIFQLLKNDQVDKAREQLAMIVGRDVAAYQAEDIARATVETVAENFVDGVLSPLFFAAIGGAPLALTYKMINTLDSMVGYKNERYRQFGCTAARIDDVANFIPARLSVLVITVAGHFLTGNGKRAFKTAVREGSRHGSPNAGFPEAAFAGTLGVKLNGPNYYGGELVNKPYIGKDLGLVKTDHIQLACHLMLLASILGCALSWGVLLLLR